MIQEPCPDDLSARSNVARVCPFHLSSHIHFQLRLLSQIYVPISIPYPPQFHYRSRPTFQCWWPLMPQYHTLLTDWDASCTSCLHCYNDIWAALRAGQRAALVRLTRSALVCYTSGLDNTGCAIRLRQQANEEWRWTDSSWNWWRRYRVL